jgi:uncharacterized protein DUF1566
MKKTFILSVAIITVGILLAHQTYAVKDLLHKLEPSCTSTFTDLGNGMILDNCTRLIWQQDTSTTHPVWSDAIAYCDNLVLGGKSDWRLPTANELTTMIDYSLNSTRGNPAASSLFHFVFNENFPGGLSYWSQTEDIETGNFQVNPPTYNRAWTVDFSNPHTSGSLKTEPLEARCVRN